MLFSISKHAKDQLKLRGIEENVIVEILNNPGQIIIEDDKTLYQSIIIEAGKKYLIRVFVNHTKTPNLVITAYKTSKIEKYYEGDI